MRNTSFSPTTSSISPSFATGTRLARDNETALRTDAARALGALARNAGSIAAPNLASSTASTAGSLADLAPSPPAVGRFAALLQHIGNFALSVSALSVASLATVKETYESSALSNAHKITLGTATAASLTSLMDLAVAVGKYCNPSASSAQIQNTAWLASAGSLLGSKHLETYGGKYQATLLGTSMILFINGAGQLAGGHDGKKEIDDAVTPGPLALARPSETPATELQHLDTLQNCIGFAALAYRVFGDAITTGVIDWMSAKEAKRHMDVVQRALDYEEPFGAAGTYKTRNAESDLEAGEVSDDSGMDDGSLRSVSSSVPYVPDAPLVSTL
ncbi:hypothetical protein [Pandoraea anhela]|uniref:Uncharacterized protein n=1 Tax=Pandoraea anhela TaxID=2508295 RepID=A0A5E4S367_9BURK|nr:hypothetical protein [Pandoraea anhela]VVD70087.1 hypothetical protein PAN31108_00580 [Pandoraea anhela]